MDAAVLAAQAALAVPLAERGKVRLEGVRVGGGLRFAIPSRSRASDADVLYGALMVFFSGTGVVVRRFDDGDASVVEVGPPGGRAMRFEFVGDVSGDGDVCEIGVHGSVLSISGVASPPSLVGWPGASVRRGSFRLINGNAITFRP